MTHAETMTWEELAPTEYDDLWDECDHCGDAGPDVVTVPVEICDSDVGYRETVYLCRTCVDARSRR